MLVVAPSGESVVMEVAATDEERAQGLMGRTEVPRGTGMYFAFDSPGRHSFWMLHCLVPLDIAWLDATNKVVWVGENLPICRAVPCPSYDPDVESTSVIELGAGEARRMGIVAGAHVMISPLPARPKP